MSDTRVWEDGDVVTFEWEHTYHSGARIGEKYIETHVAIRRDLGWKDGQWQVAIHGFWRLPDETITRMVNERKAFVMIPKTVDEVQ